MGLSQSRHGLCAAVLVAAGCGTEAMPGLLSGQDAGGDVVTLPQIEPLPDADPGAPLQPFTIIVLPDTQFYAKQYPQIFEAQARWVVEQMDALRIAFVLHEGDIVDDDREEQWQVAARSLRMLDGKVPYVLAAGNHDLMPASREAPLMNKYFPVAKFMANPWWKGTFEPDKVQNSYQLFRAGGAEWLVLSLEFGPRDEVLLWADGILGGFAGTPAIVVTHAYLYSDNTRYDHRSGRQQAWNPHQYGLPGTTNDGEDMWQKLVSRHDNVKFVLSGHVALPGGTTGRLSSTRTSGSHVHELLANYQHCVAIGPVGCIDFMAMRNLEGGGGFLRIMTIDPNHHRVQVRTYSPYWREFKTDPENQFELMLDP